MSDLSPVDVIKTNFKALVAFNLKVASNFEEGGGKVKITFSDRNTKLIDRDQAIGWLQQDVLAALEKSNPPEQFFDDVKSDPVLRIAVGAAVVSNCETGWFRLWSRGKYADLARQLMEVLVGNTPPTPSAVAKSPAYVAKANYDTAVRFALDGLPAEEQVRVSLDSPDGATKYTDDVVAEMGIAVVRGLTGEGVDSFLRSASRDPLLLAAVAAVASTDQGFYPNMQFCGKLDVLPQVAGHLSEGMGVEL